MKKKLWMIGVGWLLSLGVAHAAASQSGVTTINFLLSYNSYGSGDVIFKLANPTSDCVGYWITKTDAGFSANMAMLLTAYQTKTSVVIDATTDQMWPGSVNGYCKLYDIRYPN
ncbi:MAG: hypothetical protein ABUS47_02855 [Steroidobacter sp.]